MSLPFESTTEAQGALIGAVARRGLGGLSPLAGVAGLGLGGIGGC